MGPFGATNPNASQSQSSGGGGDSFSPSQLAGTQPDAGQGQSPEAQSNAMSAIVGQIREIEQQLQAMAQQFPAAAPEIRAALDANRQVLKRIVSSPAMAEPAAPRILG